MVIRTNLPAQKSYGIMAMNDTSLKKSLEKLSSGLKINRAADDVSGMVSSEKMETETRGLAVGSDNLTQGLSVVQTADGALQEVNDILLRLRELDLRAMNGIYTSVEREDLAIEAQELIDEIDRIAKTTNIDGVYPLDGSKQLDAAGWPSFDPEAVLDAQLGTEPLSQNGQLNLSAVSEDGQYRLINSAESKVQMRVQTAGGDIPLTLPDDFIYQSSSASGNQWSNVFAYTGNGLDFEVEQTVTMEPKTENSQNQFYTISYKVKNNSGSEMAMDMMQHVNTTYNRDDRAQRYYVEGEKKLDSTRYVTQEMPESVTVFAPEKGLPFTTVVKPDPQGEDPEYLLMSEYNEVTKWSAYSSNKPELPEMPEGTDLGMAMAWMDKRIPANGEMSFSMKIGIQAAAADENLPVYDEEAESAAHWMWLQTSANTGDGFYVELADTRIETLTLDEFKGFDPIELAEEFFNNIDFAMRTVLHHRSGFGAAESRIDHATKNNDNYYENLSASKSRIKDTDMAYQMMEFTKMNILKQSAQAMMTHAYQDSEMVLQLLQ